MKSGFRTLRLVERTTAASPESVASLPTVVRAWGVDWNGTTA